MEVYGKPDPLCTMLREKPTHKGVSACNKLQFQTKDLHRVCVADAGMHAVSKRL